MNLDCHEKKRNYELKIYAFCADMYYNKTIQEAKNFDKFCEFQDNDAMTKKKSGYLNPMTTPHSNKTIIFYFI